MNRRELFEAFAIVMGVVLFGLCLAVVEITIKFDRGEWPPVETAEMATDPSTE